MDYARESLSDQWERRKGRANEVKKHINGHCWVKSAPWFNAKKEKKKKTLVKATGNETEMFFVLLQSFFFFIFTLMVKSLLNWVPQHHNIELWSPAVYLPHSAGLLIEGGGLVLLLLGGWGARSGVRSFKGLRQSDGQTECNAVWQAPATPSGSLKTHASLIWASRAF